MNIDLKRKKEKRNSVIRWCIYILLLAVSYIYMTTAPLTLRTPLFVIPVAMCIAMYEKPFESALIGSLAGMLLDTAQGTLIGFSSVVMLWCCLGASLLFHFLMRRHIVNIITLNAAAIFIQAILHYFFFYVIWEYDPDGHIFLDKFLPVMIYTEIAVLPFFFIIKFLVMKFGVIVENYVEEKSDDIVRE